MNLLCISREEKTNLILFMRSKFSFPYVNICFDVPHSVFILKNSSLKWLFPPNFVADTKILYDYNFVVPLTFYVTRVVN